MTPDQTQFENAIKDTRAMIEQEEAALRFQYALQLVPGDTNRPTDVRTPLSVILRNQLLMLERQQDNGNGRRAD